MALKDCRVLYVEDEPDTQRLIKQFLEMRTKEVYVASNGKDGLSLYQEKQPDIVLSDICMPDMDGLEMSEEIKRLNPEQQIALFTAFSEPEYLQKAAELDIGTYMLKPFDKDQFFNSLEYLAMIVETNNSLKS